MHVEDRWMKTGPNGRKIRTSRYGSGKRWRAVWTEPDGTRRRKSCTTRDEAEAALADIRVAQLTGSYIAPNRSKTTVAEVAEDWVAAQIHQRRTSQDAIRIRLDRTILPTLGDQRIDQVTRATIQAAIREWSTTLAPSTVAVAYKYTAAIFRHAVDDKRIPTSPCTRINLPAVVHEAVVPLTVDQVQALTEAMWKPYQRLAAFIAATGVRGGEARGLTWDRVKARGDGAAVTIDRQLLTSEPAWGPPKTPTSVRTIAVGPRTVATLGPRGQGLVFTTAGGRPISRKNMSEAWRRAARIVGIEGRTGFHDLRDFHASQLIAGGASPVAVARRLGHKDPTETLRTYAHLWHDDEERMVAATDGVVRLPAPS